MHSKFKIWDYFKLNKEGIKSSEKGTYAFAAYDSFYLSYIKSHFNKSLLEESGYSVLTGKDITSTWIDNNLNSLSLFGNNESYIVIQADQISSDVKEVIKQGLDTSDRFLILLFDLPSDDLYKNLVKSKEVYSIEIQAPAFWEMEKLLGFWSNELSVLLSYDAKNYILDNMEHTDLNFYNLLNTLKLSFDSKEVNSSDVEGLISKTRVDQFALANLLGQRRMKEFYKALSELDIDFDSYRGLFYFFQTHLLKLIDPSVIEAKSKKTRYDTQVINQSTAWNHAGGLKAMEYFKELENDAKLKSPFLKSKIRSSYMRSLI